MVKTKGSADYSFCSRTLSDRLSRKATEEEEKKQTNLKKAKKKNWDSSVTKIYNEQCKGLEGDPSLHLIP